MRKIINIAQCNMCKEYVYYNELNPNEKEEKSCICGNLTIMGKNNFIGRRSSLNFTELSRNSPFMPLFTEHQPLVFRKLVIDKKKAIECRLESAGLICTGLSICCHVDSDFFNEDIGRVIAENRMAQALRNKKNSCIYEYESVNYDEIYLSALIDELLCDESN